MSERLEFREGDLDSDPVIALLREHLEEMHRLTPPESVHALDADSLRAPEVTFWSVWRGRRLVGCGALKELDPMHGEIKSMRTALRQRRRGIGRVVLEYLVAEARRRGYERLSLETGAMEAFAPARALYARFGFRECGPFEGYVEDPNSVFMTLELSDGRQDRRPD